MKFDLAADMSGETQNTYEYAAFLSYSTNPDYRLVRETEAFLEQFHTMLPRELRNSVSPLKVCMDGSDFSRTRSPYKVEPRSESPITTTIRQNLNKSQFLVVFCSSGGARSPWVNEEVAWFVRINGPARVLLVVSEGDDPLQNPEEVFPGAVLLNDIHKQPWYDFRAATQSKQSWQDWLFARNVGEIQNSKLRNFEDARVQLACHLNGSSAGDLLPLWRREQRQRQIKSRRRWTYALGCILSLLFILAIIIPEVRIEHAKNDLHRLGISVADNGRFMAHAFSVKNEAEEDLNLDEAASNLATLFRNGKMVTIDFSFSGIRSLLALQSLRSVETLKLEVNSFASLEPLQKLEHVKYLGLADNPYLTDASISSISHLHGLKALDLSNCPQISDECIPILSRMGIESLNLNKCSRITNASVPLLLKMPLRRLEIIGTEILIDVPMAREIAASKTLQELVCKPAPGDLQSKILKRVLKVPVSGL